MPQEETDKTISDRLHRVFPSPQVARQVINIVTSHRPIGASHRSYYPYYKKSCAEEIRPFIDGMLGNKQDIIYKYEVWCTETTGISRDTLYYRVNQSIRFLIERMDTEDKKYSNWYETVDVLRKRGVGVVITYKKTVGVDGLKPEFVQPKIQMPSWRKKLDEWLESENIEPFVVENLALSPDEIKQLKIELAQLTSVQADISMSAIKIIRIND
jgi:hypothetical protein